MKKTMIRIGSLLLTFVLLAGLLPMLATGASALTLEEKQRALVLTAFAYYDKGFPVQYDSTGLSVVGKSKHGPLRITYETAPEYATKDETLFSVCSDFCYQTFYDAFRYKLRKDPIYASTGLIARFMPETDPICAYRYDSHTDQTPRDEALTKFMAQLQPGDMINSVTVVNGGGHAMFYIGDFFGDGTKYLLHCSGYKYNTKTGLDQPECSPGKVKSILGKVKPCEGADRNNNAISLVSCEEYMRNKFSLPGRKHCILSIIRPLNVLTDAENPITPAALTRLQFPRLVYNRTASKMRFTDIEEGGALTLTVELQNHSKEAYTVPVKEVVPDNVTFVKASDGATVDGKNLSWDVTVPAGGSASVSYDCTVNAKRGEKVTFTGGKAGEIPSNTIYITVGGKHLTAAENELLTKVAKGEYKDLFKNVAKDKIPSLVWQKVLNLNVQFPSAKVLVNEVFKKINVADKGVYVPRDDLQGELLAYKNMIVPEFAGGFYYGEMDSLHRVLDLRCDYLQPGDVVYEIEKIEAPSNGQILVYLGNEKFLRQVRSDGGAASADFFELQRGHTFNLFVALRPTLAYDDVHTLPALANPVTTGALQFKDVQKSDWFYTYVKELVEDGTVSGMNATTFAPNGTLTYGQALKLIALGVGEKEPAKSGSHWASGYLTLAKSKGWLTKDVDLDGTITRVELCRIAAKAKDLTTQPEKNPFKDTDDADVLALVNAGVISGMTKTELQPDGKLTRAQISKIIFMLRDAVDAKNTETIAAATDED